MYYATNMAGARIRIDNALQGETYTCPLCGAPLIQKRGRINAHHFSHQARKNCDEWYSDKSDWHQAWQMQFPRAFQEIPIIIGTDQHIADIAIKNIVVEFQHSTISIDHFQERSVFYSCGGRKLIWVIDCRKEYQTERIVWDDDVLPGINQYRWLQPKKYLAGVVPRSQSNIEVFLQIDESTLLQVLAISCSYSGKYSYKMFSAHEIDQLDFVEYVKSLINPSWLPPAYLKQQYIQARSRLFNQGVLL